MILCRIVTDFKMSFLLHFWQVSMRISSVIELRKHLKPHSSSSISSPISIRIIPSTRTSDMTHLVVMMISYIIHLVVMVIRRVWRYQRGSQNPYIEEKQTPQWPQEKTKQRSTKHTHKTKDRVTRTPLKTGGELRCSGRVSSYRKILCRYGPSNSNMCLFWRFW